MTISSCCTRDSLAVTMAPLVSLSCWQRRAIFRLARHLASSVPPASHQPYSRPIAPCPSPKDIMRQLSARSASRRVSASMQRWRVEPMRAMASTSSLLRIAVSSRSSASSSDSRRDSSSRMRLRCARTSARGSVMSAGLVCRHQVLLHLQQSVGDPVRVDGVLAVADRVLQCRYALGVDLGGFLYGLRQGEHAPGGISDVDAVDARLRRAGGRADRDTGAYLLDRAAAAAGPEGTTIQSFDTVCH